jgi:hypothetical protein
LSRGLLLLFLVLGGAVQAAPSTRPTRAALQRVLDAARDALVTVKGPKAAGPGVVVGRGGEILTTVDHVALEHAEITRGGSSHAGRVLYAQASTRLALVQASSPSAGATPPDGLDWRAVPVNGLEALETGAWVIALEEGQGGLTPRALQVRAPVKLAAPHVSLRARLPLGTPLFDARGRLVALVVRRGKGSLVHALPLGSLQRAVAGGGPT